jgi:hypothetical protein
MTSGLGKRNIKIEDISNELEKDENNLIPFNKLAKQYNNYDDDNYCKFFQYSFGNINILSKFKELILNKIKIDKDDLFIINSMNILESLTFDECKIDFVIDTYPINIKKLYILLFLSERVKIKNLPQNLKYLKIKRVDLLHSSESKDMLPDGLLNLDISDSYVNGNVFEYLPFNLPKNLQELNIDLFNKLLELPDLKHLNKLIILNISNCIYLKDIPAFPITIQKLKIENCDKISNIRISENLNDLGLVGGYSYSPIIQEFPQGLNKLYLDNCHNMDKLDSLPYNLGFLHLERLNELLNLNLPQNLYSLRLIWCENIEILPIFPKSLRILEINELDGLASEDLIIHDELEELKLTRINILKLDHIPHKLKLLSIQDMNELNITNPIIPFTLKSLKIINSSKTGIDFNQLHNTKIEELNIENFNNIGVLSSFPETLKLLSINNFNNLIEISNLPLNLKVLELTYCHSLLKVPILPSKLKRLVISECNNLISLGINNSNLLENDYDSKLPDSLRYLYLHRLKNLQTIGKLPDGLQTLNLLFCLDEMIIKSSLPQELRKLWIYQSNKYFEFSNLA